jgi:hypothetical protein
MKIHRRIIATGIEWKPCRECGRKFIEGEILTAVDSEGIAGVVHWFCEKCTEELFGYLLRKGWRKTWKLNRKGKKEEIDWNGAA